MMPPDPNNREVVDALQALTNQLTKLNLFYDREQQRTSETNVTDHQQREAEKLNTARQAVSGSPQLSASDLVADYQTRRGGISQAENIAQRLGVPYQAPGRIASLRDAMAGWDVQRDQPIQQQQPGSVGPSGSTPEAVGGKRMGQFSSGGRSHGLSDQEAMAWGMIDTHAPGPLGRMAMESWGLQKQLGWAQNAAGSSVDNLQKGGGQIPKGVPFIGGKAIPGLNEENMGALSKGLQYAQENPFKAYAAYKTVQGVGHLASGISSNLEGYQAMGEQFGAGPPSIGGQNIFGNRNPLGNYGTAAQTGAAFNVEEQGLMGRIPGYGFGSGMNSQQAKEAMGAIAGQGFSMRPENPVISAISSIPGIGGPLAGLISGLTNSGPKGDAALIGQNFAKPLANKYGLGLDQAKTNEEFDPALRNAGTSVSQLTDTLSGLGQEAKTTKLTVDGMRDAIYSAGQSFQNMGSSAGGSYGLAKGFNDITGMNPEVLSQLAQNPMYQGLALGQGILPSGIGDMNPGMGTGIGTQTVQMYAQMLQGLNHPITKNVGGHQVIEETGQTRVEDQIAKMTGLQPSDINRLLGDSRGNNARSNLGNYLGTTSGMTGGGTGFGALLNKGKGPKGSLDTEQYNQANSYWKDLIQPNWKDTGISKKQMDKISGEKSMKQRYTDLNNAMSKAAGNSPYNQVQQGPNTFTINLSPQAAKLFGISGGPSNGKKQSNAGQSSISGRVNTPPGDITNTALQAGLGDSYGGGSGHTATIMP